MPTEGDMVAGVGPIVTWKLVYSSDMTERQPRWTLVYDSLQSTSPWLGKTWAFYDDHHSAREREDRLLAAGRNPTLRPFDPEVDSPYLAGEIQVPDFWTPIGRILGMEECGPGTTGRKQIKVIVFSLVSEIGTPLYELSEENLQTISYALGVLHPSFPDVPETDRQLVLDELRLWLGWQRTQDIG